MCRSQKFWGCCLRSSDVSGPAGGARLRGFSILSVETTSCRAWVLQDGCFPHRKCLAYSVCIISHGASHFKILRPPFRSKLPVDGPGQHPHEQAFEREILVGCQQTRIRFLREKLPEIRRNPHDACKSAHPKKQFRSTRNYGPYDEDRSCYSLGDGFATRSDPK